MLTLTLAPFDHNDDLQRIPEMHFTAAGNDYWLLLPAFEKIEEKTGKLIDLGESLSFNLQEIELIREVLSKEIETLDKEINEDAGHRQRSFVWSSWHWVNHGTGSSWHNVIVRLGQANVGSEYLAQPFLIIL